MNRRWLLPLVAVLAFMAGIVATSTYRDRVERRDATQQQFVSALDEVATAHLTLRILDKKGADSLKTWCQGNILRGIGNAHAALRVGASSHGLAVPNMTRAFSQATTSLRERGGNPSALTQAEEVLAHLSPDQVPSP